MGFYTSLFKNIKVPNFLQFIFIRYVTPKTYMHVRSRLKHLISNISDKNHLFKCKLALYIKEGALISPNLPAGQISVPPFLVTIIVSNGKLTQMIGRGCNARHL